VSWLCQGLATERIDNQVVGSKASRSRYVRIDDDVVRTCIAHQSDDSR